MADRVIFMGWNRPIPGREMMAAELMQKTLTYLGGLQGKGAFESFETVILSRHGGDMNGFILIKGTGEKLTALKNNDDFINLTMEGSIHLDGFGLVEGYVGDGVNDIMGRWVKLLPKG